MTDKHTIELLIHGENLPGVTHGNHTQVRLGIQKEQEVEQDISGDAENAEFTATLQVKRNAKDGRPMFSGPFVFGTSKAPFLYLSWGERREGKFEMFSRVKLPLEGLEWTLIHKALDTGRPVEMVVNLTNEKGKPVCATLDDRQMRWLK